MYYSCPSSSLESRSQFISASFNTIEWPNIPIRHDNIAKHYPIMMAKGTTDVCPEGLITLSVQISVTLMYTYRSTRKLVNSRGWWKMVYTKGERYFYHPANKRISPKAPKMLYVERPHRLLGANGETRGCQGESRWNLQERPERGLSDTSQIFTKQSELSGNTHLY